MPHNDASLPAFVAIGEALTDMIVESGEPDCWRSKVGGSTWNVARAMARLGVPSAFAGAISEDVFGDALWKASAAAELDLRYLQRVNKAPLLAFVHRTDPPDYFFVGDDSADLHFAPERLPAGWIGSCKWAHFGGISLARPPLAARLVALARTLKLAGIAVSFDPNYRKLANGRFDDSLREMTALADVVKVSEEDLLGLFRDADIERSFATLRSWNPGAHYLYTKGARGASLHIGNEQWSAPPPRIEVIDSVGAGDASIAALAYSLLRHRERSPQQHLGFAVAAGAAACLSQGATPPSLASIETLLPY
ncbi:MAG TPA: carbohydrate kinase [Burkholderiaceae bacterium]